MLFLSTEGFEPTTDALSVRCSTDELCLQPTVTCCSRCSTPCWMPNTTRPLAFHLAGYRASLQASGWSLPKPTFCSCDGASPSHANGQTVHLPVGIRRSTPWLVTGRGANHVAPHRSALVPSFRTCNGVLPLTAIPLTGVAFGAGTSESTLTLACLDGPFERRWCVGFPALGASLRLS